MEQHVNQRVDELTEHCGEESVSRHVSMDIF